MKYWNKHLGRQDWSPVTNVPFTFEAKVWCQRNSSKGRFYMGHYTRAWLFEFSEDALAFKLKYFGQKSI